MRSSALKAARILVIDDEQVVRELVVMVLSEAGYDAEGMQDARKALSALETEHFDLLLVDINMPGMNGIDFFQALGRREPEIASRVIFVTGSADEPEIGKFLKSSGRPVLAKPFDLSMLERIVESQLKQFGSSTRVV